jgi:ribosomal protein S16
MIPANNAPPSPPGDQNQGGRKKADQDTRQKMTVDRYLKRVPQGAGIGELVRSLYKTTIMTFEEWETTVKTLLKKQVR